MSNKATNKKAGIELSTDALTSFEAITSHDITILILGSMPGIKSLELSEYYGHPRNRFWNLLSLITNEKFPTNYTEKKKLLAKHKIGIWDLAHTANRKGSLDSALKNVVPNDIDGFITQHKKLKVIGFNGTKAKALYDKYFERKSYIKYITLPSSSPANMKINFEELLLQWKSLMIK